MANVSVANADAQLSAKNLITLEADQTITGLKTFSRGAQAPFAVAVGSLLVANLDADKLDGQEGTYYLDTTNHTNPMSTYAPGRLTLTTALPVTTADVTGAGTIYYTPYGGYRIALYTGTVWAIYTLTEISLVLTVTSGKNYDVFVYNNAGTLTLELSAAWTNDTTRADALTTQNGILVKSSATTRRYIGTIRASGANTTEDSFAKRFVWNMYNRVNRPLRVMETTDTWTYTLTTVRQANASAANQLALVCGVAEDAIAIHVMVCGYGDVSGGVISIGIGDNVTNAIASWCIQSSQSFSTSTYIDTAVAFGTVIPAAGYQFYAWVERVNIAGTITFLGDNGSAVTPKSGIFGLWRA